MPFDNTDFQADVVESIEHRALRLTREQIAAGKWCTGVMMDEHDKRCLVGWLQSLSSCGTSLAICRRLLSMPGPVANFTGHAVYADQALMLFNDACGRDAVLELLDAALAADDGAGCQ